jgi:hypothetical protein
MNYTNLFYNGFDWDYRKKSIPVQKAALSAGIIPPPSRCITCHQTNGYLVMHCEDYDAPLNYIPLCYPCHKALHDRFKRPKQWGKYYEAVKKGFRPIVFKSYDWRLYHRAYLDQPVGNWPGSWTDEPGDMIFFDALSMEELSYVPEHLRVSKGAPHLPGQIKPAVDGTGGVQLSFI